jgi:hypothetical protein
MRTYDKNILGNINDSYYGNSCETKLVDTVFDYEIYEFVPRIVVLTWRNCLRQMESGHFNESRIKYHHHPISIYDINIEEYNSYKISLELIKEHMLAEIHRRMKLDREIASKIYISKGLIRAYIKMVDVLTHKMNTITNNIGPIDENTHRCNVYKSLPKQEVPDYSLNNMLPKSIEKFKNQKPSKSIKLYVIILILIMFFLFQ